MSSRWAKDVAVAEEIGAAVEREKPKTEGIEENFDVFVNGSEMYLRGPAGSLDRVEAVEPSKYCFGYTMWDDGPDPVYYFMNRYDAGQTHAPILPGENVRGDFERPLIRKLIFRCDDGKTANVRLKLLR